MDAYQRNRGQYAETYDGYVDRTIKPALGDAAINKITARMLESLYADLRRCRGRCDGKPFIEHKKEGDRDCGTAKCKRTSANRWRLRQSGRSTPSLAALWMLPSAGTWIGSNPARVARKSRQK